MSKFIMAANYGNRDVNEVVYFNKELVTMAETHLQTSDIDTPKEITRRFITIYFGSRDDNFYQWQVGIDAGLTHFNNLIDDINEKEVIIKYAIDKDGLWRKAEYKCPKCKDNKICWEHNFCPSCGIGINWKEES
ncbi:MAG: hypothetical protein GTO45_22290 [Candidatus Aminicenantes bacterium]|nr:hypothetical protein [Candidatus Aminicenantes bacterium]NIM84085.1 hypothetical protein [Candidatus Aminicenantes bacterium]NIN20865.1 hypothetical protein [Candidatus Aminicenantes bacterium]NIN44686.1 hypothetical protein [Candidatus Aminicenantes bacterium]NIN87494.1 hypothetical protein [Candidatus Aminicenantes bacterium]